MIKCELIESEAQTSHAPLCLLGHYLARHEVLAPLAKVALPQKTVKHSPTQKLIDALIAILSGCEALYEINVRVRPDEPLGRAFGRNIVAEQSTVSRTLDAFDEESVGRLREAVEEIQRYHSKLLGHDFEREMLVLEMDLTGLRASKNAEGSTKGYFASERNATGRQLARVSAPRYGEVVFEKLHPGNTNSSEVLKETFIEVERVLELDKSKRGRTLVRLDGGFGTDANINWLLWRGYQLIVKGYGGRRASMVSKSVPEDGWLEGPTKGQELGVPTRAHRYARTTKTIARRWTDKKGKLHRDLLITTRTELESEEVARLYDGRGGMEVDIKGDKRGLGIEKRRKKSFHAQEALVLLAQLAHNLLTWFKRWFLEGGSAAKLGAERLVREVMSMPDWVKVNTSGSKVRLRLPNLRAVGKLRCSRS